MEIPYRIAVLAYVFNDEGKLLLLHRRRPPNRDLYSPIGGKLEQQLGESPYACCLREIEEEIGVVLTLDEIRLMGIVSERGYAAASEAGAESHWLMFCFEATRRLNFAPMEFDEGRLEWIDPIIIPQLDIPKTDREVIWPLVRAHSTMLHPAQRLHGGDAFFSVHIDCSAGGELLVTREYPRAGMKD